MTLQLGVVGRPIGHSISPAFQQAALDACGFDARYERYDVPPENLAEFVAEVRGPEWLGLNVTIPHKQAVMRLVDRYTPEALRIGAVNTIVNRQGVLLGHNTDARGFLRALREHGFEPAEGKAVVLGVGGSARAVAAGLCEAGAGRVVLLGRSEERVIALVAEVRRWHEGAEVLAAAWTPDALRTALTDTSLLVNTTPVGMAGGGAEGESPVPAELLRPDVFVFDLVYNPGATRLLQWAQRAGARCAGGLDMLVHQGAESFELWTGVPAPIETMRAAARQALDGR